MTAHTNPLDPSNVESVLRDFAFVHERAMEVIEAVQKRLMEAESLAASWEKASAVNCDWMIQYQMRSIVAEERLRMAEKHLTACKAECRAWRNATDRGRLVWSLNSRASISDTWTLESVSEINAARAATDAAGGVS